MDNASVEDFLRIFDDGFIDVRVTNLFIAQNINLFLRNPDFSYDKSKSRDC